MIPLYIKITNIVYKIEPLRGYYFVNLEKLAEDMKNQGYKVKFNREKFPGLIIINPSFISEKINHITIFENAKMIVSAKNSLEEEDIKKIYDFLEKYTSKIW